MEIRATPLHARKRVIAKMKDGRYNSERRCSWIKIKNPAYTQIVGRQDLFQKKNAVGNLHLRRECNIEVIR